MKRKLLVLGLLLLASTCHAAVDTNYPYFYHDVEIQRPREEHVLDRIFSGNTPGLAMRMYSDGSAWTTAATNWTWYFRYSYGQYDTNGMVSIAGTAVAHIVYFLGATNVTFEERDDYYFSLVGLHNSGYAKTYATGRMIEDYDPGTETNILTLMGQINMAWWTNNLGALVVSNTARIEVLEAVAGVATNDIFVLQTAFDSYTNTQDMTNQWFYTYVTNLTDETYTGLVAGAGINIAESGRSATWSVTNVMRLDIITAMLTNMNMDTFSITNIESLVYTNGISVQNTFVATNDADYLAALTNLAFSAGTNFSDSISSRTSTITYPTNLNFYSDFSALSNRVYTVETGKQSIVTENTNTYGGDVSGVRTNIQIGTNVVTLTEVDTSSLDTRYVVSGEATNVYDSLWIYGTGLDSEASGFSGVYTGQANTTVAWTQSVTSAIGKTYKFGFQKIGADGTATLSFASVTLTGTTVGAYSDYAACTLTTQTNAILTLIGETTAFCNASNVSVKAVTNGYANIANELRLGGDALLGTIATRTGTTQAFQEVSFAGTNLSAYMRSLLDDANEATFKASINAEGGVDFQVWGADLDKLALNDGGSLTNLLSSSLIGNINTNRMTNGLHAVAFSGDHGGMGGLSDVADHAYALRTNDSRTLDLTSATLSVNAPGSGAHAATKTYVDTATNTLYLSITSGVGTVFQAHDSDLDGISALSPASNDVMQSNGSGWTNVPPVLATNDPAGVLYSGVSSNLYWLTEAQFKELYNLEIGTDVQAYNTNLAAWSNIGTNAGIDESNLDASVNASLDLADSAVQDNDTGLTLGGNFTSTGTLDGQEGSYYLNDANTTNRVANDTWTTNFLQTPTIQGNPIITNVSGGTVASLGSATFTTVQAMQDVFHSGGYVSGGTITTGGVGTLNVAAGTGLIRASDNDTNTLYFFDWPASNGIPMASNSACYIGVNYAGGTPVVTSTLNYVWNFQTDFPLGNVVDENGTKHIENAPHKVGDHANLMIQRTYQTMAKERDDELGGLILGETGTRNITVSGGALWERLQRFIISAIDTSGADTFDSYVGTNMQYSGTNQWDNTSYDNGGVYTTLSANRYAVLWFYIELDGGLLCVYGTAEYTSEATAELEAPPTSVPLRVSVQSELIGRLIFKKSQATAEAIESVFGQVFAGAVVTDHGNLAGLSDDDHEQYTLVTGAREFSGNIGFGGNRGTNAADAVAETDLTSFRQAKNAAILTNRVANNTWTTNLTNSVTIESTLEVTGTISQDGTNVLLDSDIDVTVPSVAKSQDYANITNNVDVFLRDGSVALTDDVDFGSFAVSNHGDLVFWSGATAEIKHGGNAEGVHIGGGGSADSFSGAFIRLHGNDIGDSLSGTLELGAGDNTTNGTITLRTGTNIVRITINQDGSVQGHGNIWSNFVFGSDVDLPATQLVGNVPKTVFTNLTSITVSNSASVTYAITNLPDSEWNLVHGWMYVSDTNNNPFSATGTNSLYSDSARTGGRDLISRVEMLLVGVSITNTIAVGTNVLGVSDTSDFAINDMLRLVGTNTDDVRISSKTVSTLTLENTPGNSYTTNNGCHSAPAIGGMTFYDATLSNTLWGKIAFGETQTVNLVMEIIGQK